MCLASQKHFAIICNFRRRQFAASHSQLVVVVATTSYAKDGILWVLYTVVLTDGNSSSHADIDRFSLEINFAFHYYLLYADDDDDASNGRRLSPIPGS